MLKIHKPETTIKISAGDDVWQKIQDIDFSNFHVMATLEKSSCSVNGFVAVQATLHEIIPVNKVSNKFGVSYKPGFVPMGIGRGFIRWGSSVADDITAISLFKR